MLSAPVIPVEQLKLSVAPMMDCADSSRKDNGLNPLADFRIAA